MKISLLILLLLISCHSTPPAMHTIPSNKNLHHFSFRTAFMSGLYQEHFTIGQLKKQGDFGLGTFNLLDGEMIVLRGKVYQAKADGEVIEVTDERVEFPSAMVTHFRADWQWEFSQLSQPELVNWIAANLETDKVMYALLVEGTFSHVRARSQAPVVDTPFPPIDEVVDAMVYHAHTHVQGTLVGFQLPPYLEGINYPGLHFHFVGSGGHQLRPLLGGCAPSFQIKEATLSVMELKSFSVAIPQSEAYRQLDMTPDKNNVM